MQTRSYALGLAVLIAFAGGAALAQEKPKDDKKKEHPVKEEYRKKLQQAEEAYLKVREEVRKELLGEEKKAQEAVDKAQAEMRKGVRDAATRKQSFEAWRKALDELNKVRGLRMEVERPKILGLPSLSARRVDEGGRLGAKYSWRIDDSLRAQIGLEKGKGQLITSVVKDRAAAKAGLKPHDVLLKLDGKDVPGDLIGFRKLLDGVKADTEVEAVVVREGKQQTVKITLPAASELPSRGRPVRPILPKKPKKPGER